VKTGKQIYYTIKKITIFRNKVNKGSVRLAHCKLSNVLERNLKS
jgi:hypothetical protein